MELAKRETHCEREWAQPAITSPWPLAGAVSELEVADESGIERESGGKGQNPRGLSLGPRRLNPLRNILPISHREGLESVLVARLGLLLGM